MKNEYLNNKEFENVIKRFQQFKREKIRLEFMIEDIRESVTKRQKYKKLPFYDLDQCLGEYQLASNNFVLSQQELATAFYTLSEHLVRYAKDIISDTDDAIQEGVMICFEKIDRFNPDRGKAFNYMTTCVINHFRHIYRISKNYKQLKERYRIFLFEKFHHVIIKNGKEIHLGDVQFD